MKETISYAELKDRIGDMVACDALENNLHATMFLISGIDSEYISDITRNEFNEIVAKEGHYKGFIHFDDFLVNSYDNKIPNHWFIITDEGAHYLLENTTELVCYDKKLKVCAWGVTDGNAPWNDIFLTIEHKERGTR